jgi:hypothetical protein
VRGKQIYEIGLYIDCQLTEEILHLLWRDFSLKNLNEATLDRKKS